MGLLNTKIHENYLVHIIKDERETLDFKMERAKQLRKQRIQNSESYDHTIMTYTISHLRVLLFFGEKKNFTHTKKNNFLKSAILHGNTYPIYHSNQALLPNFGLALSFLEN